MDYSSFKTYLTNHLWKVGDSVVINALDTLILTANAELDKVLKVEDRAVTAVLSATSNVLPTPDDYKTMRAVTIPSNGASLPFSYVTPDVIQRAQVNFVGSFLPIYSTVKSDILLCTNASVSSPLDVTLTYTNKIPDYQALGESWVADNFFDVYLYCVLKHSAPFLREDERVAMWNGYYREALDAALVDNDDVKYSGSPLEIIFS